MRALDIAVTAPVTLAWAGAGSRRHHRRHCCSDRNPGDYRSLGGSKVAQCCGKEPV